MLDSTPGNITAILALGMALAFVVVDYRSRTSRWLSLFLVGLALSIWSNVNFIRAHPDMFAIHSDELLPWWIGFPGLATAFSVFAGAQWIKRVRCTIPAGTLNTQMGDKSLLIGQALAIIYALLSFVVPEWRVKYFLGATMAPEQWSDWRFIVLVGLLSLALLMVIDAALVTLRRKPEPGEKIRLVGLCIATPFLVSGLILPYDWASYGTTTGLIIVLVSAMQYHVLQGHQGQFMRRFLSPQVAKLVRQRGLQDTLGDTTMEVSVIACDLRGFTQYAAQRDSAEVISFLREYYDYIGSIAREFDATIKDYAGDGVLMLVGAPIAQQQHAQIAVNLACAIRDRRANFLPEDMSLGLGIGVATGPVSVGIIGGERLEYAAVGAAVNLAARLCDHAANGEVRVAASTAEHIKQAPCDLKIEPSPAAILKGIDQPVENFLVAQLQ